MLGLQLLLAGLTDQPHSCSADVLTAMLHAEYHMLKSQLASEAFPPLEEGGPQRFFSQLDAEEQRKLLTARLKKYCQKV